MESPALLVVDLVGEDVDVGVPAGLSIVRTQSVRMEWPVPKHSPTARAAGRPTLLPARAVSASTVMHSLSFALRLALRA